MEKEIKIAKIECRHCGNQVVIKDGGGQCKNCLRIYLEKT